ncbi:MAG: archaetidylinositol phosphate synthase [Candidatus Methanoperedens sp.]|nr:archaetidylinositol phosphate synthase [Candidatus Methanoperedens sp.]
MLYRIKNSVRDALRPLAKKFISVNPNTLTVSGLLISLVSAVFFAKGEVMTAGIFLLLGGFFDALDGAVARENNRITNFGGFLDSVCDRFADAAVLIGAMYGNLTAIPPFSGWFIGTMAIVGSLMVSYTRARAEAAGGNAAIGIGERAVRVIILITGAFTGMVNWAVLLIAVLSFITVFQRIIHVRKVLK